ncbi:E3 ubiquitin-protein ligase RHA1B [Zea mays]|jgi:RING-H2 zinc finger protein RHA1|uniref:Putative RING zinc finger domain superfamily protein n=1 Tax=Zea mays TaxID=4577 RepID=K7TVK4_MAIZE|nr:E3 ubiquitin-protein ligase RHA1B [Zea mays]AQK45403.1 Putative RING zinc finger domain superfamily protein [Zea mays]|eukprot:XP_008663464.1 E3 ubiquitin-protein ligase RHA1B [Zea mays]
MGFPAGYSELVLPKQLLHLLLLLGYVRRFLLWAFDAVGLGDLLDLGDDHQAPQPQPQHRRAEFRAAMPAMVIEEALPVARFDELEARVVVGGDCAVCLGGIGGGDEVRRLGNCRHAFHRACLDRWMEHDQRTCPLCRAPLIPGAALWPADASDLDFSYPGAPLTPVVPSPTLLRPHELLLLAGLGGY